MNKQYIDAITEIANKNIKKQYHDLSIKPWQVRYALEAKEEFDKQHIHKTEGFH